MTNLTLLRKEQQYIGFICEGHSGYADAGDDIVCAAISALTQFCLSYALTYRLPVEYLQNEDQATIRCKLKCPNAEFSKLLKILDINADTLQQDYPRNIRLKITEVY